jgi:signal transduction histidine kinase
LKLWHKASLICVAVLIAVVVICSTTLLIHAKNSILDVTWKQAQEKQKNLAASFLEMTNYYLMDADSDAVKRTLVMYCFTRFADSSSVLIQGDETLFSEVTIGPAAYLRLDSALSAQQTYEGEIENRNVLIVGSELTIGGDEFCIYVVEDISTVYNSIMDMVWFYVAVSVLGILFGTGLIMVLLRRGTRPLASLASVSQKIANGRYDMRSTVHTNDEIGALAGDFNLMADAVETRIAQLTETADRQQLFIGGVTHEFKTPLTSLLLHARMLRRANMTDEEKDVSLEHIETQSEWLERLVQTLLKLITLEEQLEIQDVSVSELFEQVRQSTRQSLAERNVTLEVCCGDEYLPMNPDLTRSLLINLIDNASKSYDDNSSNRTVVLSVTDNILEVKDCGRGIPPDSLSRVFEPFYMVDASRSKRLGGSGLGLSLAKRVADAHGAKLELESEFGKGTVVRLTLELQNSYN